MFRPTLRRLAEAPRLTLNANPYKAQKEWPPDFTKLHPKHQFRLERRYRRRAKLRYSRPRWTKAVKLAASGSSFCQCSSGLSNYFCLLIARAVILVYGVLFMDWGEMAGRDVKPFEEVRPTLCMERENQEYADTDRDTGVGSQPDRLDLDS